MDLNLSFVLPVYNVEAYLPQCLDSMLSQMGDSCEIILVDDGTPDHSALGLPAPCLYKEFCVLYRHP